MSGLCPRCGASLEAAQVATVEVALCRPCQGVLIDHADLTQILDQS